MTLDSGILVDFEAKLGFLKQLKSMPFEFIWDYYCYKMDVPPEDSWINEVISYENKVLSKRNIR